MNRPVVVTLIVLALLGGILLFKKLRTPKSIFAEPLIPTPLYEPAAGANISASTSTVIKP